MTAKQRKKFVGDNIASFWPPTKYIELGNGYERVKMTDLDK
jgi:hypothetical protein